LKKQLEDKSLENKTALDQLKTEKPRSEKEK